MPKATKVKKRRVSASAIAIPKTRDVSDMDLGEVYLLDFQQFLEVKKLSLKRFRRITQHHDLLGSLKNKDVKNLWASIEFIRKDILMNLTQYETTIKYGGMEHNFDELMTNYDAVEWLEEPSMEKIQPWTMYLDGMLGYVNTQQLMQLEDLHLKLNEELNEFYYVLEYREKSQKSY
jgi:hypothetical protein